MNNFYDWKPEYFSPVVSIISASIGFIIYWFIAANPKIKVYYFSKHKEEDAWIKFIFFQKIIGLLFIGIIPGIIALALLPYSLADYGFKLGNVTQSAICIPIMCILIVLVSFRSARTPFNLRVYPQMRLTEWNKKRLLINALGWASYLFAYEFLCRGLLLITCYHSFGFWPALAINLCFYATTHIAKGLSETIGTFIYGVVLCFVTILTGSLLAAFVTHLFLALTNDYFSIRYSREMKFV